MFSLVKFHNDKFSVVKSKCVQKIDRKICVVKYNGAKYSAFLISQCDNKSKLLDLKHKNEEKSFSRKTISSSTSSFAKTKNNIISSSFNSCENQTIVTRDKITFFDSSSSNISPIKSLSLTETSNNVVDKAAMDEHNINNYTEGNGEHTSVAVSSNNNEYEHLRSVHEKEASSLNYNSELSESISIDNGNTARNVDHNLENINISKNAANSTLGGISSKDATANTFSEYNPELSSNISESILENCGKSTIDINETVNEIDMPLNVDKVIVPYSKTNLKKHFCIFCKKMQCKVSRHFFLKHPDEVDVKRASLLPKRSLERIQILNNLRKKGDFEHNTSSEYNTGILIVSRRQQRKYKNTVDDYLCCKFCKGFFSKRTLRLHRPNCGKLKKTISNAAESHKLTQYLHPAASKALKLTVFPILRNGIVVQSIRNDELIIKYANKLIEKYSSQHQHDMIRSQLRTLGRFLIQVKDIDPSIEQLKDIYKPEKFDTCVKALRRVSSWNENLMWFMKPSTATSLTSLIKKCGNKQRTEFIKENREDLKTQLENFLLLWEEEVPLINKKALEDQANQKRNKKVVLPLKEDIKKLYDYLKTAIVTAIKEISEKFSMIIWMKLVEATLIFIQIFNRRRAGEIERLSIENFKNKESITDTIDKDVLKTVSKDSLKFAKQFVRISLRGKLGRTVAVLLCPMSIKAVELIMHHRVEAGIADQNNYIFAKPTSSKLTKPYLRACPLLKKFSKECGAKFPESLRGTTLRKHIATHTAMLNVEEASVERLANFMGHQKEIHKNIYRMPIPVAEITCVSKLLMAAVGEEHDVEDDDDEDDEENENFEFANNFENNDDAKNDEETILESNLSSSSSGNRKRRSTSPYGKTKRFRWSDKEREAIISIFGDIMTLEMLPTLPECLDAIRKSPALCKRTPEQVKSWIDNQRRYKSK